MDNVIQFEIIVKNNIIFLFLKYISICTHVYISTRFNKYQKIESHVKSTNRTKQ